MATGILTFDLLIFAVCFMVAFLLWLDAKADGDLIAAGMSRTYWLVAGALFVMNFVALIKVNL